MIRSPLFFMAATIRMKALISLLFTMMIAIKNITKSSRSRKRMHLISFVSILSKGEIRMDIHELYERYHRRVFFSAYKVVKNKSLAEDVVQETYLKAYRKLDELTDEKKAGAWLSTIAGRKAVDLLRKEGKAVVVSLEQTPLPASLCQQASLVEEMCELHLLEEEIETSIRSLSPKIREVFRLSFQYSMKEKEVADFLNLSLSAVKSRLHRGRKQLKQTFIQKKTVENPA
ncbi:sigma-70 family RNA polymerase sigma factor [Halobacillus litoralis]|nr:sigma-70 family RNA polymerase sigma factor [Halobacillus litoralis]